MPRSSYAPIDALYLAGAEWEFQQRREEVKVRPTALEWAREHVSVVTPWAGRVPFVPYSYQEEFLTNPAPRRLILKARQVGMSNAVAIEAVYKSVTTSDRMILVVSRTGQLAQHLVTYCRHTLATIKDAPELRRENLSELEFANGSRILSLAATPSAGRGFPATDVYLDEFAFVEYDDLIYQSIIPTLPASGTLTVLSSANGRGNLFFNLWSGLDGADWSRQRIHWSDCPRYKDDPEWEPRTRAEMTKQGFAEEFDCDFLASGDAVFDPDDLARCRVGFDGNADTCEETVTAWDIGRRQDHTVGGTIGRRGDIWHLVEYERFLAPYPVIQNRIEDRARRRGKTWVESNGVGDPVIENLTESVEPFVTTAKTKVQAIQALQLLIQQGRFKHDSDQLDRELSLYQWDDKALIQDSVMMAAIAAYQVIEAQPGQVLFL